MKIHRKTLVSGLVVLAVLVIVYVIVQVAVLNPAADMDSDIRRLKKENAHLKRYNDQETKYRRKLKAYAGQTFGLDPIEVSELIRVRIDKMVSATGLQRGQDASTPISGKTKSGVYEEVGWSYDLTGTLEQVVSMMYLLHADPYLHRLGGLSIVPNRDGTEYKLSFKYVTLVLVARDNETLPIGLDDGEPKPIPPLKAKPQQWYQRIARRNLFRPFIAKPKPQPKPQSSKPSNPQPQPKPTPEVDLSRFKISNLSQMGSEVLITVLDSQTGLAKRYRPGENLAGGRIVMVDYRELPRSDKPELLSPSRVVIQIKDQYFAIDLGRTLADRYRLEGQKVPPALRPSSLRQGGEENLRTHPG